MQNSNPQRKIETKRIDDPHVPKIFPCYARYNICNLKTILTVWELFEN